MTIMTYIYGKDDDTDDDIDDNDGDNDEDYEDDEDDVVGDKECNGGDDYDKNGR